MLRQIVQQKIGIYFDTFNILIQDVIDNMLLTRLILLHYV